MYLGDYTQYAVVVKTDAYAGNFEREMTAYITGATGDCSVGDKVVALFMEDMGIESEDDMESEDNLFWDVIGQVADEHGCYRPCTIYNDDDQYQSFVIFFDEQPTVELLNVITERANKYCKDKKRLKQISEFISGPKKIINVFPLKIETKVTPCKPSAK